MAIDKVTLQNYSQLFGIKLTDSIVDQLLALNVEVLPGNTCQALSAIAILFNKSIVDNDCVNIDYFNCVAKEQGCNITLSDSLNKAAIIGISRHNDYCC